ncbi:phospho-sugar mutase [Candidatus Poribacteria bacterium]
MTDYIAEIEKGFRSLNAGDEFKQEALRNIRTWLHDDEFGPYREQIIDLVKRREFELLLDSFYQVIPFGTGGRRGPVGIGTNRINPWTIAASAQGHSNYLMKQYGEDAKKRGVVLAYDVRVYPETGIYNDELSNLVKGITSKDLAVEAAKVYTANNIKVYLFDDIRTTPELSFAIRYLKAVSGDMFSASHNPKTDNGKKVYEHNGGQLIPPYDQELADTVNRVTEIKRMDFDEARESGLVISIGDEIDEAYLKETTAKTLIDDRDAVIAYSPLHGVGSTSVYKTLKRLGFNVVYDEKTKKPDGGFTNVRFNIPNPEVEESFDTLFEAGDAINADVLISSDPDADRVGICIKTDAGYVYLNGNEIGIVLTQYILSELSQQEKLPENPVVAKTLVTTELCRAIAGKFGCEFIGDLLVGCKYIAEEIRKLEEKGEADRFIIGLEESHGYMVGIYARDKDAAPPAVLLCELASRLKKEGKTIIDYLDAVYKEYGYHKNHLSNIILRGAEGKTKIDMIQKALREDPPSSLAGFEVARFVDKWDGDPYVSDTDKTSRNVLIFELESDEKLMKATVRPSGTEPKTKIYFEVGGNPPGLDATDEELEQEKQRVINLVGELEKDLMNHCYSIIGVDMPDRNLALSSLLSVAVKQQYFDVEAEIVNLKSAVESDAREKDEARERIDDMMLIFGADPVEKITKAFEIKTGVALEEFLKFLG